MLRGRALNGHEGLFPMSLMETILVYVNDKPVQIYQGMKVKHALIAFDQDLYKAARSGEFAVKNADGFVVDLDGSLSDGSRIYLVKTER